jgi:hypothetical protein
MTQTEMIFKSTNLDEFRSTRRPRGIHGRPRCLDCGLRGVETQSCGCGRYAVSAASDQEILVEAIMRGELPSSKDNVVSIESGG